MTRRSSKIEIRLLPINEESMAEAVRILSAGGGAFSTDTVYGVGAHALQIQAVEKIYAAKIRPWDKAIPLLLTAPDDLSLVAESIPPSSTRWRILRSLRMNAEARRGRTSQWMGHMTANPRD